MAADDDAGQAEALTELRARVAEEHFGDAEYADVLRNQTEDGLRSEAERLRARGLGPSPGNGSPSWAAEVWRNARRQEA